jgi:hypothetical protein
MPGRRNIETIDKISNKSLFINTLNSLSLIHKYPDKVLRSILKTRQLSNVNEQNSNKCSKGN